MVLYTEIIRCISTFFQSIKIPYGNGCFREKLLHEHAGFIIFLIGFEKLVFELPASWIKKQFNDDSQVRCSSHVNKLKKHKPDEKKKR